MAEKISLENQFFLPCRKKSFPFNVNGIFKAKILSLERKREKYLITILINNRKFKAVSNVKLKEKEEVFLEVLKKEPQIILKLIGKKQSLKSLFFLRLEDIFQKEIEENKLKGISLILNEELNVNDLKQILKGKAFSNFSEALKFEKIINFILRNDQIYLFFIPIFIEKKLNFMKMIINWNNKRKESKFSKNIDLKIFLNFDVLGKIFLHLNLLEFFIDLEIFLEEEIKKNFIKVYEKELIKAINNNTKYKLRSFKLKVSEDPEKNFFEVLKNKDEFFIDYLL